MKRFFQPIQKDGSSKKPTLSVQSNDGDGEGETREQKNLKEPLRFLTWNANSFLLRVKNNWPEFTKFVESLDPDIISIQEVRMPAAGSKGAPKNQGELKDDTSSSREEKQILMRAISNPPFRNYNVWWSLSDSKYAGTGLFIKKCFQPKKICFSLDQTALKHEPDGRVILAEFESFRLLNTYSPNNGWKEEENSFQRRRKWDKRIMEFVLQNSDKPLIWCGDLNVSHEDIDVSHPEFFSSAKLNGYIPPNKEDTGQPGFTLAERKRFGAILREGKLVDAYRFLHKEKDMEQGFSWSGNPVGKYRGKRMRIDYFVVSEKLKDRIVSCEMHGHGIELQGFYGSDHCPLSLELSPSSPDSKPNPSPHVPSED
ncbi:DNA-(apurinic or apyrimidinic site) endonuclease [Diospyros lotus]|uniref:DNA-(apurinic or apyrimidinic site) endonuclease n=1 Tax=Diospyros lotus TaxID=55363 RepID=UPI002258D126|nr:DNA-(apurinic or apyrimidinic site) endonuclease [Diospyros lotus]